MVNKLVKIKKADLTKGPVHLLQKLGALNETLGRTYPMHVYISRADYDILKTYTAKLFKKESLHSKRSLANAVGMEILNHGPNSLLQDGIKPGFAVVNTGALRQNMQADRDAAVTEIANRRKANQDLFDKIEHVKQEPKMTLLNKIVKLFA